MKVLLAFIGLAVIVSQAVLADQELADKLKPFEAFSPYKWTQWIAMRPSSRPIAAAAVAYAPQPEMAPQPYPYQPATDSAEDDDDDDDDSDEDSDEIDPLNAESAFASWFKRAILPQPPPAPEGKVKKVKKVKVPTEPTTKKPSIVELPPGFWAPPPSIIPTLTAPPPPGYYAAKKSMFISKLFAALAKSVLNETENATATAAPEPTVTPVPTAAPEPTTVSQRQAILDELSELLLSDVKRSVKPEDHTTEPEEFEDSDEDSSDSESDEVTAAPRKIKPTTVNPFLLSQIDFLAKLTEAIAATQTEPTPVAPVTTTTTTPKPRPTTTPKPDKKSAKKGAKKSSKKLAKTPAYMKWIPTTTTPSPTEAPAPAAPAAQEIDYNALARALLGNTKV